MDTENNPRSNYLSCLGEGRTKLVLALGTVCLVLVSCDEKPAKNVLFIMVDDLRPTFGCYGDDYAVTPYVDDFASEATVYMRAYCQQALSGPTRASLLTGLRPEENGVTELNTWIRRKNPDVVTLPQAFKSAGYRTVSVGKTFHGKKNTLDSLSWSCTPLCYEYTKTDEYGLEINKTGKKAASSEFLDGDEGWYLDMKIRKAAQAQLKELAKSGKPFFLAVGFLKPHLPFCAPSRFLELYDGRALGPVDKARICGAPEVAYHNSEELRGYTDIGKDSITVDVDLKLRKAYYACASFADENIGAVISELKALGLYDNTVIVVLGDHGYHLGDQDLWCKSTNYEAACRAPLIIKDAGERSGRRIDVPVEFIDLFPTLTNMCGIDCLENLPGKDLSSVSDSDSIRYCAFSQFPRPYSALHRRKDRTHMGYTVRDRRWRYVEWYDTSGVLTATELYDMGDGFVEKVNLCAKPSAEPSLLDVSRRQSCASANLCASPEYVEVQMELSRMLNEVFNLSSHH